MAKFEMFACFQDKMVLQRESDVKIWGFADEGTFLNMEFCGKEYTAAADNEGEFVFNIRTNEAGGPFSMKICSGEDTLTINDILIGDVYIISGQSNMELPVERTIDLIGPRLSEINYPEIREFRVPEQICFGRTERQFRGGMWLKASNQDDILKMSATGFNFAENVHINEHIPIGLVNNAIGGTPIEAHLPEDVIKQYKIYDEELEKLKDDSFVEGVKEYDANDLSDWYTKLDETDPGIIEGKAVYAETDFDDSDWKAVNIPGMFYDTELEDFHGSVWFRKEFYIPENYNLHGVMLRLGAMVDGDKVYLNGIQVGSVDYCYPPRRYPLNDGILKHGRNVLTIRLIINRGTGGFICGKKYCLQGNAYIFEGSYKGNAGNLKDAEPECGRWEFDVSGEWKYITGACMRVLPLMTFFQYKPTALYNGMMHPLLKYSFKGGLWYQAESNAGEPFRYENLMTDLIKCWRRWFGNDLPFFFVQLPQFNDPAARVMSDNWAEIREQQRRVTKINNTAMAVAIDIGESNDLHPQNKEAVGKRLALAALSMIYGKDNEYSGPEIISAMCDEEKSEVSLAFSHCSQGLMAVNDNFDYFELGIIKEGSKADDIYSDNIEWFKASGCKVVSVNTIKVLYHMDSPHIDAVRYAWFNDPCKPPLYNGEGLPASPFAVFVN